MSRLYTRAFKSLCWAVACLSLSSTPLWAESHALIMTISQYRNGVKPLQGVMHDAASAARIAQEMGVDPQNMYLLRDNQLTLEGMRAAFRAIEAKIRLGDQLFVYYSGHGGRFDTGDADNRCAEALITVDAKLMIDAELEWSLKKLSDKAQKVIVFLDACHSGGAVTRSASDNSEFVPKYWEGDGERSCSKPVNVITRGLQANSKAAGSGANNFVYITAARDNEVAIDIPDRGGVATQSWLYCMANAPDRDGSGGINAEEIRECAQDKIDRILSKSQRVSPHHVTIHGNREMVLKLTDTPSPSGGGQSANHSANISPVALLRDIYNGRDDRRVVKVATSKQTLKINRDYIDFQLQSSHDGYLYLLMVDSDGKTFDMIFPNKLDDNNYIQASQSVSLPRNNWRLMAQAPAGETQVLAIVTDSPRDFSSAGLTASGPFSTMSANVNTANGIQRVSRTSDHANSNECKSQTGTRALAVVEKKCSSAYGATMFSVRAVE